MTRERHASPETPLPAGKPVPPHDCDGWRYSMYGDTDMPCPVCGAEREASK